MTAYSEASGIVFLSFEEFEAACDSYEGFCIDCKEVTNSGVEPDARRYECEACGKRTVYGMEEALLMGAISIASDSNPGKEVT
jgi:hypothetical protein